MDAKDSSSPDVEMSGCERFLLITGVTGPRIICPEMIMPLPIEGFSVSTLSKSDHNESSDGGILTDLQG